jgi:hypothetical protein
MNIETIFFENKKDDDKFEPLCECNLCYIFRNITLFLTQPLKYKVYPHNCIKLDTVNKM